MNKELMFSSKTPEWSTPQELFDRLDQKYHFTLDPASTHENAKCKCHFTIEEDGLKQMWGGKSCSAILHMAAKSANGLRKDLKNHRIQEQPLSCFFLLEQILNGSMIIARRARLNLSKGD